MQNTYALTGLSEKSRSALVSASPGEVLDLSRRWAKSLGLVELRSSDSSKAFSLPRFWLPWAGLEILVRTLPKEEGETDVLVTVSGHSGPERTKDLVRIAETFAARLCADLARDGVTVVPRGLGSRPGNVRAMQRLTWALNVLYFTLGIILIPACVAGVLLLQPRAFAGFLIAVWVLLSMVACEVVRWRTLGARARLQTISVSFGYLMAIVFTLIFAFVA